MRRWPWIVLALTLAAAVTLAYAAANLNAYLTENRDALAARASAALGRKVEFASVEVSFRRGLGVALGGLAVADDSRFSNAPFLEAERAVVRVRVLPALFGRYEIASVLLDTPKLAIVRTKDGLNISSLGSKPDAAKSDEAPASSGGAVAVALVDVENGKLVFTDRTVKPMREVVVDAVDLSASDWSAGESLRFELAAAVLGAAAPNLKASGAVGPFDTSNSDATALDVVVQLDDADLKALAAALALAAPLRTKGALQGKVHAGGTVGAPSLELSLDAGAAEIAYGDAFAKAAGVPLSAIGNIARDARGRLTIDSLALTLGSAVLETSGALTPIGDSTSYAVKITGASVPLGALGQLFPSLGSQGVRGDADIDLDVASASLGAPESFEGRVSLDGFEIGGGTDVPMVSQLTTVVRLDGRSVALPRSDLRIAGLPATLEASCPDLYAPRIRFTVAAPSLALAELGIAGAASGDKLDGLSATGTVVSTARSVDLDATVRADSGLLGGLAFTKLDATVRRRDGALEVTPLTLGTCDGQLRGNLKFAPAGAGGAQRFHFDGRAERVSIAELATSITGLSSSLLEGKLTLDLRADGAGKDWSAIQQALTGNAKVELLDGALHGVNVADSALAGITGLPGLSGLLSERLRGDFPLLFGTEDTRFDALSAALEIAAGRMIAKDLTVNARDFALQGGGTIGLDGSVDLAATLLPSVELSRRLIAEAGVMKHLADRSGRVVIPFRLAGALPAARPMPDVSALAAALQRGLIENLGDRILDGDKKPVTPREEPATEKKKAAGEGKKKRAPAAAPEAVPAPKVTPAPVPAPVR